MYSIDIKRLMYDLDIKQKDIADTIGVHPANVSKVKKGQMDFPKSWIKPLEEEYNINIEDYYLDVDKAADEAVKIHMKRKGVPVYDVDLDATNAPSFEQYAALKPEYYINIPFFKGCDFAGRVKGDSMYPKYRHGDIVVCKRITNKDFILYGEVYLIISKSDNYRTVKYVKEDQEDNNNVWLIPQNLEVHDAQLMPKEEILELYHVRGSIRQ